MLSIVEVFQAQLSHRPIIGSVMGGVDDLRGLVSADTVRARVRVDRWEDAVDQAGALLVDAHICEPRYVTAMRQAIQEYGPYVVVAPGVAMPHARPEQGALRPGVAVVTLLQPVEFGSASNDPVDLIIPFAAVDKRAHIHTLQQVARLLMDDEHRTRLRTAANDQELCAALGIEPAAQPTPARDLLVSENDLGSRGRI